MLIILSLSISLKADEEKNIRKIDSLTKLISVQTGRERVETLIALSEVYRETSPDKSHETDSQAGQYASQQGLESMKGIILLSFGKTASLSGDYTLALDYINQAITALKETSNFIELANAYTNKGLVLRNMAQYDQSIEEFNKAEKIAKKHELIEQQAGASTNRATVYFSMGDYEKAMESYQQSMEIYKSLNDSLRYAKTMMNVGNVYWQWDKNELALEMLLEAKKVFENKNDLVELGRVLNNIGRIYYQDFNDTTQALAYYQQSLSIREKIGNQLGMSVVLANIGNIYRDRNQLDEAFKIYEKSLGISKFIGYKEGIALAYYYMGVARQMNEEYEISNQMLDSCRLTALAAEMTPYYAPVNESKMSNYAKLNDLEGFIAEFEIYSEMHNSVKDELHELKFKELSTRKQLEKLTFELEQTKAKIKTQQQSLVYYKIAVATLMILLFLTVFYTRKKPKRNLN